MLVGVWLLTIIVVNEVGDEGGVSLGSALCVNSSLRVLILEVSSHNVHQFGIFTF